MTSKQDGSITGVEQKNKPSKRSQRLVFVSEGVKADILVRLKKNELFGRHNPKVQHPSDSAVNAVFRMLHDDKAKYNNNNPTTGSNYNKFSEISSMSPLHRHWKNKDKLNPLPFLCDRFSKELEEFDELSLSEEVGQKRNETSQECVPMLSSLFHGLDLNRNDEVGQKEGQVLKGDGKLSPIRMEAAKVKKKPLRNVTVIEDEFCCFNTQFAENEKIQVALKLNDDESRKKVQPTHTQKVHMPPVSKDEGCQQKQQRTSMQNIKSAPESEDEKCRQKPQLAGEQKICVPAASKNEKSSHRDIFIKREDVGKNISVPVPISNCGKVPSLGTVDIERELQLYGTDSQTVTQAYIDPTVMSEEDMVKAVGAIIERVWRDPSHYLVAGQLVSHIIQQELVRRKSSRFLSVLITWCECVMADDDCLKPIDFPHWEGFGHFVVNLMCGGFSGDMLKGLVDLTFDVLDTSAKLQCMPVLTITLLRAGLFLETIDKDRMETLMSALKDISNSTVDKEVWHTLHRLLVMKEMGWEDLGDMASGLDENSCRLKDTEVQDGRVHVKTENIRPEEKDRKSVASRQQVIIKTEKL